MREKDSNRETDRQIERKRERENTEAWMSE